jgi:hypothetical protein
MNSAAIRVRDGKRHPQTGRRPQIAGYRINRFPTQPEDFRPDAAFGT